MRTTQPAAASKASFLTLRAAAVRAEMSDIEKTAKTPGQKLAVRVLRRDLLALEGRAADAQAVAS